MHEALDAFERFLHTHSPVPPLVRLRAVNQVEQIGLLREITGQARNRVYQADEVLAAIEEPLRVDDDAC